MRRNGGLPPKQAAEYSFYENTLCFHSPANGGLKQSMLKYIAGDDIHENTAV